MANVRMGSSSRRAGRVTNKTKLLVYRGSDKVDTTAAETIVWNGDNASADAAKNQHVGAKGVENGELLEHHLQAALSSASLLHSRDATKPSSPSSSRAASIKPEPSAGAGAALNYHIPTPDATGLIDTTNYAKLYQAHKFLEPQNYIRFSDTVEEAACGLGGLSYCMDDDDLAWLANFNGKAEGGSGDAGSTSPAQGRGARTKGKDREKETPAALHISEDTFEYIMGVLEKHAEDTLPMLHTNLAAMPTFPQVETLFSSPLASSFYPSNEVPKGLPETRVLVRMARSVFPHWKSRREKRGGKTIMPQLNYDETNDNDPYVCFRRRDVRAARKTRRTDNHSVEQFQKLQFELKRAYELAQLVLKRETEKKALYAADKEVWEAKWKLFETKRRWPSLGVTREEEEIITGRQNGAAAAAAAVAAMQNGQMTGINPGMFGGNQLRNRRNTDKDRDDRDRRERALEASRAAERLTVPGKSMAPEAVRERLQALHSKLDEELARRKAIDSHWDDYTDNSYQPLPSLPATHGFRPIGVLDVHHRSDEDTDEEERTVHPMAFRLRRGRGGRVVLDRKLPVRASRRGAMPPSPDKLRKWYFPDLVDGRISLRRPRSIDDVDGDDGLEDVSAPKRQKLNEVTRYDASRGGAVGVGMGLSADDDRLVIDDYDSKYIRHRVTLLRDDDLVKLKPDTTNLAQALMDLSAPVDLPPPPKFIKPAPTNPQLVAYQQQMMQQQQMEQLQRFQLLAQQQAAEQVRAQQQQQQQAFAQAQVAQAQAAQAQVQQAQAQAMQTNGSSTGTPNGTPQMLPPNGVANGRPASAIKRSPTNETRASPSPSVASQTTQNGTAQAQQTPQAATPQTPIPGQQSPHVMNGGIMLQNGKTFVPGGPGGVPGIPTPVGALDPQIQQQRIAAARAQMLAQQATQQAVTEINLESYTPEQRRELQTLAMQNGYGPNIQAFVDARQRARILSMAKLAANQQAQVHQAAVAAQMQVPGLMPQVQVPQVIPGMGVNVNIANGVGNNVNGYQSPNMGQLQLKLPPHAAARLAGTQPPTPQPQAQAQRS